MSSEKLLVVQFNKVDQQNFYKTLRSRVNAYFEQKKNTRQGNWTMHIKTIFMLSVYIVPFILIMSNQFPSWASYLFYAVMGLGIVGIGMNIMHDAMHGSYTNNQKLNRLLGYSLDFVGGCSSNWFIQHNILHHTYTNIYGLDADIHDKPILRLAPTGKWSPIHRFQHIYALALYGLSSISWVTMGDVRQLLSYRKRGLGKQAGQNFKLTATILLLTKVAYVLTFICLPIWFTDLSLGQVLLGFLLMHVVAGVVLTTVFQLAHVIELTEYPTPDADGNIENTWAIHQLHTTADFAKDSRLLSWLVGGLNFQVEHHLFPNICHIHYPKISPIVEQTAKEFGVPYLEHKTFGAALVSHLKMLKRLGQKPVNRKTTAP
ncbi:MAG: acyl-CoA desaturase [Aureispira sp.]|nr:acyl-CoA desaturase [Aureispira sp.]